MRTKFPAVVGRVVALAMVGLVAGGCAIGGGADSGQGRYIYYASGGCGCHGPSLAGYKAGGPPELPASAPFGELFTGPFGSVAAANISPDKEFGLGQWTDEQVIRAIRDGIDNHGQPLYPIMPYNSFHFMSDQDARNLVAFLRSQRAIANKVPERKLNGPVPPIPSLPSPPATAPTGGVERGEYLVTAVSDCGSCHTPRTTDGRPDSTKLLAGAAFRRPNGQFEIAPNITPDKDTGIGNWTEKQIATLIRTLVRPDGSTIDGSMVGPVIGGYDKLTDDDARDIAAYLKTVPPVKNTPHLP